MTVVYRPPLKISVSLSGLPIQILQLQLQYNYKEQDWEFESKFSIQSLLSEIKLETNCSCELIKINDMGRSIAN